MKESTNKIVKFKNLDEFKSNPEKLKHEMFFYFDIIIKTCGESETLKKKKAEHIKDYINLFLKIYDDSNIVFRENFYNKYIDYIRKQIVKKGPFIHVLLCS